jgi:hypothetical protein
MAGGGKRGVKPVTARDWIFGSRPRRLLLGLALSTQPPETGWTKAEIARNCGVGTHGGADEHITGLVALGLLIERDGRYWPMAPTNKLGDRVSALLKELDAVPECRIDELLAAPGVWSST